MVRKVELDPMGNNTLILQHYIIATGKAIIDNKIFDLIHAFFDSGLGAPSGPGAPRAPDDGFSGKCHFESVFSCVPCLCAGLLYL